MAASMDASNGRGADALSENFPAVTAIVVTAVGPASSSTGRRQDPREGEAGTFGRGLDWLSALATRRRRYSKAPASDG